MPSLSSTSGSTLEIAHSNQDLIITKRSRKKRVWLFGAIAIALTIVVVVCCLTLISDEPSSPSKLRRLRAPSGPTIALEDFLSGRLIPRSFNASWVSDSELLYRGLDGSVQLYDVSQKKAKTLLSASTPILMNAYEFTLSPDGKFLMIAHDFQKIYRHSYIAHYSVVNLATKSITKVMADRDGRLQFAKWAPVGNAVVFVTQFNIYYKPAVEGSEFIMVTADGLNGHIYNGIPDWVYEEEVFSSKSALWFSPDGTKLAFAKFNDTRVPLMSFPVYGQPGNVEFQYTRGIQIRYPKPGTKNPDVTLHVVHLNGDKPGNEILETPTNLGSEPILAAVTWADNATVCAIWNNRIQNEANIVTYQVDGDDQHVTMVRKLKEKAGWLELFAPPIFDPSGMRMAIILSQPQKSGGSFRHVTLIDRSINNVSSIPLTHGKFVVIEILTWDHNKNLIYYQANTEDNPAAEHVYSVHVETHETKCHSCSGQTSRRKMNCLQNAAKFSAAHSYYVLQCLGPDVPEIAIYKTNHLEKHALWESNDALLDYVHNREIPIVKRLTFPIADGFTAQVMLKLPACVDMSGTTKYPMLVKVYGGPNSCEVTETFALDWGSYLTANKSIIHAVIDARGSGLKGDDILFSIYNNLGNKEIVDQINVTRQIQESLPYIDANRTAIWGWSYGGYSSGMALAQDTQNVFKCGISVAPVTDWILYDSIYTERFMGLPVTNSNGYMRARLLNKYEGMRNKTYYLIHGTLDDNVHYQQSMMWSKVLEEHDILFRQQSYPDQEHSLSSVRPHLYHSLERFLDECFDL